MMVSDTKKPYRRFIKHQYKKIILLFLVFLLIFIAYDTIAINKNKDNLRTFSGNIVFKGGPPSQTVSIAIILESGEIIEKVDTDKYWFFSFIFSTDVEGKVSFLIWIDDETYIAEDEHGNIKYLDLSKNLDQYIMVYVDNLIQLPKDEEENIDDINESDTPDKQDEEPPSETIPPNNESPDSSDSSDDSDQQQNNTDSSPNNQQNETDNPSTNTTTNPEQSDNSTTNHQDNTTSEPSQNTTNSSQETRTTHNIILRKTIWNEETQNWETQRYLEINQEVIYNISVYNNDTGNLSNITIVDYLPTGIIFQKNNNTENNSNYHQWYDPLNHTIKWNITRIMANQTITFHYRCITISSGKQSNVVNLNASGNGNMWYEKNASTDLFVFGNIFVSKQVWDSQTLTWTDHLIAPVDSLLRMNITIIYKGGFTLNNLFCIDNMSDDMKFLGNVTINGFSSTIAYNETKHQFIWNTSQLDNDEPVYIEFDVKIFNQSVHVNHATVSGNESIGKQLTGYAKVIVESLPEDQIYISKKVGYTMDSLFETMNATINQIILFSIDIQNIGNATIFNMTLRDSLPSSMAYIENSATFLFQNKSFKNNPIIDEETNMLTWLRVQTIIEDHIGPYEQCQLTFNVTLLSLGSFVNSVNFSYGRFDGKNTFKSSSMDTVTVNVIDQIQLLHVDINASDKIYVNTTENFHTMVSGGIIPYSYNWDFDDGTNSTESSPFHKYTTPGRYNISVIVTDSNNSRATASKLIIVLLKDVTPPDINLSLPTHFIYIKGREITPFFITLIFGKIEIQGTVFDNESDIELIQLFIDKSEVTTFDNSPFSWSWEKRVFGRHEIKIVAIDAQGNQNLVETTVWKFF